MSELPSRHPEALLAENARLKAEVERLTERLGGVRLIVTEEMYDELNTKYLEQQHELQNIALTARQILDEKIDLKEQVERLTKQNALATPRHLIASQDIKTLREQIEELKLENSQYEEHHKYGQNVITSLREEVERLTKAGDEMLSEWASGDEKDAENFLKALVIWNAAKEGNPRD
jgi:chromosome segregation ATPase